MTDESDDSPLPFPERTCVACRQTAEKEDLVRLTCSPDGQLMIDYRGKLPGRGAWVHPDRSCIEKLEHKPGILNRALAASWTAVELYPPMLHQVQQAALDGISMAAAAGALVGGKDALEQAIRENRVMEIVVASDASPRTLKEIRHVSGDTMLFTGVPLDREHLGERIGRGARAALGVTASRAASHLRRQLRRLRALG